MSDFALVVGRVDSSLIATPPAPKRAPFGWPVVAIGHEKPLRITFDSVDTLDNVTIEFGFCVALERRDTVVVRIATPATARTVATVDVTCPFVFNIFRTGLDPEILRDGIDLTLETPGDALWIFAAASRDERSESADGPSPYHLPHVTRGRRADSSETAVAEFARRLASRASVQQFGWMEGCVLNGLEELQRATDGTAYDAAIADHLALFESFGRLVYENPRSEPADGTVYGVEGTLPVATIARRKPSAFAVGAAVQYWAGKTDDTGVIHDGSVTAEGSYTVAYPIAVVGQATGDKALTKAAIRQLEARAEALHVGEDVYLRLHADGSRSFRNWGRAWAWYLLGGIRTIETIGVAAIPEEILGDFRDAAASALSRQDSDGLWHCYCGEPETGTECSSSAGVAAAFAIGSRIGVLGREYHAAAHRAADVIAQHLTIDGFLTNCSQSNKGGEQLQRSGYRVVSQFAMGLFGQLLGALADDGAR